MEMQIKLIKEAYQWPCFLFSFTSTSITWTCINYSFLFKFTKWTEISSPYFPWEQTCTFVSRCTM